jgi:hypothetical protein
VTLPFISINSSFMVFLSMSTASHRHAPGMGISHRSVILGTLVTHCLQRVGKKCGAGCIAAPWWGMGSIWGRCARKKGRCTIHVKPSA